MTRGGKREGAGRKKSEPTKRISVPESLVDEVESLIIDYKSGNEKAVPSVVYDFVEMFPEYVDNFDALAPIGALFEDWELIKKLPRSHRKVILKMMQKT